MDKSYSLLNYIQYIILLLAIISIFSPVIVYIPFFLLFIILQFISEYYDGKVSTSFIHLFLLIYSFLIIASISFLLNYKLSDNIQFVKLWLNLNFLLMGILFIKKNYNNINLKSLKYTLELIICLSFIQISLNVLIMNLLYLPIQGVDNSIIAYNIVIPNIYFGTTEKNIWATKIAFIQIIYITLYNLNIIQTKKYKYNFLMLLMLFNIIYTFSRTAQLAFIISLIYFFYTSIRKNDNALKWTWKIFFLFILIGVSSIIYNKLLHLNFETSDGMFARIELWMALYNNLDKINWIWGNGVLYAKYLIANETQWTNNNMHNVILNTFVDFGLIGLFFYLSIIYKIFFDIKNSIINNLKLWALFIPFFIVINSQYLGYDNDLVIYFILVYFIEIKSTKVLKKNNLIEEI